MWKIKQAKEVCTIVVYVLLYSDCTKESNDCVMFQEWVECGFALIRRFVALFWARIWGRRACKWSGCASRWVLSVLASLPGTTMGRTPWICTPRTPPSASRLSFLRTTERKLIATSHSVGHTQGLKIKQKLFIHSQTWNKQRETYGQVLRNSL